MKNRIELKNEWSDEARAASLAVRRAKAAARRIDDGGKVYTGGSKDFDETTGERRIDDGGKVYTGDSDPEFQRQEREAMEEYAREDEADRVADEAIDDRADDLIEREEAGEALSASDKAWLTRYREIAENPGGETGDSDPVSEREVAAVYASSDEDAADREAVEAIDDQAEELIEREEAGEALSASDKAWLTRYREIVGNPGGGVLENDWSDAARAAVRLDKEKLRNRLANG